MNKIPFNLEKARRGERIIAWDGRPARIICFDRQSKKYPIVALIKHPNSDKEEIYCFQPNGIANDPNTRLYMAGNIPNGYMSAKDRKMCHTCTHFKYPKSPTYKESGLCFLNPSSPLKVTAWDACKEWKPKTK